MAQFISCRNINVVVYVEGLFFKEIVRVHTLPKRIVSEKDTKFVGYIWRTLWKKLKAYLNISSTHHPQTNGYT